MHSSSRSDIAGDSYPDLPRCDSIAGYEWDMAHSSGCAVDGNVSMNYEGVPARFGSYSIYGGATPGLFYRIPAEERSVPAVVHHPPEEKCRSLAAEYALPGCEYLSPTVFNVISAQECVIPNVFDVIPVQKYRSPADFCVIPDEKNVIPITNDSISDAFRNIPNEHTLSIILSTKRKRRAVLMEIMDETVQEATALQGPATKYQAVDGQDGIPPEQVESLAAELADASQKDTDQQKAVELVGELTAQQNEKMAEGTALIKKTREAVKGKYGEHDEVINKAFHIGIEMPKTVKKMRSELKYQQTVVVEHKADLEPHGIKDAEIALFASIEADLASIDQNQENAKKLQKAATRARNDSMKSLQKTMRRIQHTAQSIFAGQPLVLIEFESIANAGGKKSAPPPAEQPAQ